MAMQNLVNPSWDAGEEAQRQARVCVRLPPALGGLGGLRGTR